MSSNGTPGEGNEQLLHELAGRLDEIVADVAEHDEALMRIIRRGARDGALPDAGVAGKSVERQLELLDTGGAFYEQLSGPEKRLFNALLRSSLERRRHLALLLSLPDEQREAIAFAFSLDEHERSALAERVETEETDG
jgi:hypothetical protein